MSDGTANENLADPSDVTGHAPIDAFTLSGATHVVCAEVALTAESDSDIGVGALDL